MYLESNTPATHPKKPMFAKWETLEVTKDWIKPKFIQGLNANHMVIDEVYPTAQQYSVGLDMAGVAPITYQSLKEAFAGLKPMSEFTGKAQKKAEELGLCVVNPNPSLLILDLDTDAMVAAFEENLKIVKEADPTLIKSVTKSKSKSGNTHVYVKITRALKEMTRIGLQAVLGSDVKKEALSLAGSLKGDTDANVLFETKEEYDRLTTEGVF